MKVKDVIAQLGKLDQEMELEVINSDGELEEENISDCQINVGGIEIAPDPNHGNGSCPDCGAELAHQCADEICSAGCGYSRSGL